MVELLQKYIERCYDIEIRNVPYMSSYGFIIKMYNPFTNKWASQDIRFSDFHECGYLARVFSELKRKVDMV